MEDSKVTMSTKSAAAILVAVLSFGGFNMYNGQQVMNIEDGKRLETRVKSIQVSLAKHSPESVVELEDLGQALFNMLSELDTREESVRHQHTRMANQMDRIVEILQQREINSEQLHRDMDKLEVMLQDALDNQHKYK
jgi:hypothetical protein